MEFFILGSVLVGALVLFRSNGGNGDGLEPLVTYEQLFRVMPNGGELRLLSCLPHLNAAMREAGIDTPNRKAFFLAQLAHESGELRWFEEFGDGKAYDPPSSVSFKLGNVNIGDGPRFKGRGPIQLTGRKNYTEASKALGVDFVSQPNLVATVEYGFRTAAWFWETNGLNAVADRNDFERCTVIINGALSGLEDRVKYLTRAREVLGSNA